MPESPLTLSDDAVVRFLGGLWRLNRRIKQGVEPLLLERHGLDLRRYFILSAIERGQVYPKALSDALDLPPTLLSRYLEQLRGAGLIEREIDANDSRRVRLSVTSQGTEVLDAALRDFKASTHALLSQLGPARVTALLDSIELLAELSSADAPSSSYSSQEPA